MATRKLSNSFGSCQFRSWTVWPSRWWAVVGVLCSREEGNTRWQNHLPVRFAYFPVLHHSRLLLNYLLKYQNQVWTINLQSSNFALIFALLILQAGNIQEASNIYWRAKKALSNPSNFLEKYQLLQWCCFTLFKSSQFWTSKFIFTK